MSSASHVFHQAWKNAQRSDPGVCIATMFTGSDADVRYAASAIRCEPGAIVAITAGDKCQVIVVGTRFGPVTLRSVERPNMETFYQVFYPKKAIFEMTLMSRNRIASTVQIAIVVGPWGDPKRNIGNLIEEMANDFNNDIN